VRAQMRRSGRLREQAATGHSGAGACHGPQTDSRCQRAIRYYDYVFRTYHNRTPESSRVVHQARIYFHAPRRGESRSAAEATCDGPAQRGRAIACGCARIEYSPGTGEAARSAGGGPSQQTWCSAAVLHGIASVEAHPSASLRSAPPRSGEAFQATCNCPAR
jgi:hypothetical protein